MKLRTKLLAPFGVAFVLMLSLAQFVWLPINVEYAKKEFDKDQLSLLRTMEPDLARSLLNGDLGAVYSSLNYQLKTHGDIWRRIELFNREGKRLYPLRNPETKQSAKEEIRTLNYQITWENSAIAEIRLAIDWLPRREALTNSLYMLQSMILAALAAVMAVATFWQQRLIVKPVIRLADAAEKLAVGDFGTPLPEHGTDEVGKLTRSFEVMRSNLLQAQTNLLNASTKANAANTAKSNFLATMSHEIRTPMNGILGMAQLLLMPNLKEDQSRGYVRTILSSGQALLTLLNDILDLSKIEAGKVHLDTLVFDPAALLSEIEALFSGAANAKNLKLEHQWRGPPGQRYQGDAHRLRQMISNLVGNAIKFSTQGSVRLEGAEIERHAEVSLLEFSVTDTGIGIPEDKQDLLFKPFSQTESSITREFGGSGLGLSIVSQLAKLMDGEIGVESVVGQGSRFWFRARVKWCINGEDSRRHERATKNASNFYFNTDQLSGRVLVVEDNMVNRMVIEALLNKLGLTVSLLNDGQQAVDAIIHGDQSPDIILMDLHMPVMDGYTAVVQIRQWETDNQHPSLPIIALTADAFEEDRQHCLAVGMDDFLTKPIALDALRTALVKWLDAVAARRNR